MTESHTPVTVLGLGAMGSALAATLVAAGHPTTVWNRSTGKGDELVASGAQEAATVEEAVTAGDLIVVCLLDHASVHEVLDPVAGLLAERPLVNVTSTEPAAARALAEWSAVHSIPYLDGGIMAVPPMIGKSGSALLYSGSRSVFDEHLTTLELFGTAEYFGADAGHASLIDFALLSGMYVMFAGYYHGAAMARSSGMSAEEFGNRAAEWLAAMLPSLPTAGAQIDTGNYAEVLQPLTFTKTALDAIVSASRGADVDLDVIGPVRDLVDRQVAAGYGAESSERAFESLNPPARAATRV